MSFQFVSHLGKQIGQGIDPKNLFLNCLKLMVKAMRLPIQWDAIEHLNELTIENFFYYEDQFQFMMCPIKISGSDAFSHVLYPILIECNEPNNFWVLLKDVWGKSRIYNPITNKYQALKDGFSDLKILRAWQCCPTHFPLNSGRFGLFKSIIQYFKMELLSFAGMGVIVASMVLLIATLSSYIFGNLYQMSQSGHAIILLSFFLFAMGSSIISCINDFYIKTLNLKILSSILPSLWHRILSIPLKVSKKMVSGKIVQKIIDYEMSVSSIVTASQALFFDGIIMIFLLGYMAWCNLLLAILYGLICLIFLSFKLMFLPKDVQYKSLQLIQKAKLSTLLNEVFLQIHKCRSAGVESEVYQKWFHELIKEKEYEERSVKIEIFSLLLEISMPFFLFLSLYGMLYTQTEAANSLMLPFIVCAGQFTTSFEKLSASILSISHLIPGFKRLQPLFNEPIEIYVKDHSCFEPQGNLSLLNLSWRHEETDQLILDNLSMEIKAGQFVALVGPSGSGKTSVFKLLLGFESPTAGSIIIDGINIKNLNMQDIRRKFGIVLQTTSLFSGSIFSNISANANITLDEAWGLANCVCLDEEIKSMPMKMYTHLSDNPGESISGGQKQKILIARALATRPKILLLDEATSALDNESQLRIHQNLKALKITRLVIAHRYSTIKDADLIYVLNQGKIIRKGFYDELF